MGWAITSIGVTLILYFVYIELRPSMTNLYFNFVYDFTENDKGITKGKKVIVYKINKPNITQLVATGLTATGEYKDFKSNIGRITAQADDAGATKIYCDLDEPLKKGSEVSWVLTYDLIKSFEENKEEVGVPCLNQGKVGSIHLIFDKKRIPSSLRAIVSKNGIDKKQTVFEVDRDCPEIYWRFKVKFGLVFAMRWDW